MLKKIRLGTILLAFVMVIGMSTQLVPNSNNVEATSKSVTKSKSKRKVKAISKPAPKRKAKAVSKPAPKRKAKAVSEPVSGPPIEIYPSEENLGMTGYTHYRNVTTKLLSTKYVTAKGYAGGQPLKGTQFKTGGSFHWSPNGGPTISVGTGFYGFNISVNLGTNTPSNIGTVVNVPNKKQFFKLYIEKKYIIKKYAVYGVPYFETKERKHLIGYSYTKQLYDQKPYAVKQ